MSMYQANPETILYIGRWENSETTKIARSACSKAVVLFKGPYIRLHAEGDLLCSLDGGVEVAAKEFSTTDGIHSLFLTASRNTKLYSIEAEELLCTDVYLRQRLRAELEEIKQGRSPRTEKTQPVSYAAAMPTEGVRLTGFFGDQFQKGVDRVKICAKHPHHLAAYEYHGTANTGWAQWLPAANDGRLLAGAAKSYLWTKDPSLRAIVDRLVDEIEAHTRADGYSNYYPEEGAYGNLFVPNGDNEVQAVMDSEQKNFDRAFWTMGMVAAGEAGNPKAFSMVRAMNDWLYGSEYKTTLHWGHNATNVFPGNLILALSAAGTPEDLAFQQSCVDLRCMEEEFIKRNPLIFSHYPADRPHCYLLLAVLAAALEYRLTGDAHHLEAALGGWEVYDRYYKHEGSLTAICESDGPYLPGSYFITNGHTGETCGSIFWLWVNAELAQLFPDKAVYADRIEEVLFNVLPTAITPDGDVRYHNRLQGEKDPGNSISTCCEISTTHLYADLPKYVFSANNRTVYVNQFMSAETELSGLSLTTEANLFEANSFTVTITGAPAEEKNLTIRIPRWAENALVSLNGAEAAEAETFVSFDRRWSAGDRILITFTPARRLVLYTGAEQMRDGVPTPPGAPRYAFLCGPYLMALTGEYSVEIPSLTTDPTTLDVVVENRDTITVPVNEKLKFVPYHQIHREKFCVYPAYKLKPQTNNQPTDS